MSMCVFGGTFDPPHNAHFIIAEAIRENLGLSRIIFIPAANPPHKNKIASLTSIESRLEMLELCTAENPHFAISRIELDRGGISFTIDTIRQIREAEDLSADELYFLIGSDSLAEFKTWHRWEEILEECRIIVARRPRFEQESIDRDLLKRVHFLNLPRIEVSSTEMRQRYREGRMTRFYVPRMVDSYIREHKLYIDPA